MWRYATTRAWLVLLACGLTPARSDDKLPSLDPPSGVESPAAPAPAPIPGPSPVVPATPLAPVREDRGVLALPGINVPPPRRPAVVAPPPSLAPSADGGLPSLEMPRDRRADPAPSILQPLPSDRFRTRVIESSPPAEGRSEPRTVGRSPRPTITDDLPSLDDPEKDGPAPAPASSRRNSLFGGRLLPRGGTMSPPSDSAIKAEPRSDPAADAAIKRRIERQAREVIGDRARTIDVRVVGRDITIRAHGTRLWQRRTVRHLLEGLSGLSGYRSTVEVND